MRTTVDIPDETYRKLKVKAALEGEAVRQIVLRGILREIEQPSCQADATACGAHPEILRTRFDSDRQ